MGLEAKIDSYDRLINKLTAKKYGEIEKVLFGDPAGYSDSDLFKAQSVVANLKQRSDNDKSKFQAIDPFKFQNFLGWKDKPIMLSYDLLTAMAKTPIINAILRTRINQIANFFVPQNDVYSTGFVIRKKKQKEGEKLTLKEERDIEDLTEFVMNTGNKPVWESVNFERFGRLIARDSFTFDQYTFEVVFDRKGEPYSFHATDSKTIRISDSIDNELYEQWGINMSGANKTAIKGYYPSFVQILDNRIIAEFYPWEMGFGVRNPVTDIYSNGYGVSEIEEMISIITSLLWGHEYNRNIFRNGVMPKGFISYDGDINEGSLQEFRQMWYATMRGAMNSWRTPFFPANKINWVDLQKNNRDMEYTQWMEFNIKLSCSIFSIDPSEIGFPMAGESGGGKMFESSNEYKLRHSQSKGLYPILRNFQYQLNKNVFSLLKEGKYEIVFTGLDSMTPKDEQDLLEKRVKTYWTINEVREFKGKKPVEWGDRILDSSIINYLQGQEMDQRQIEGEEEVIDYAEYDKASKELENDEGGDMLNVIDNWNNHISNFNKKKKPE